MSNLINAFKIPLGPAAEPGLSQTQLKKRMEEAQKMIHAIMPSTRLLTSSVLQKRLISENGLFWLAFDLEESPQMPLFNGGLHPTGKRITSTLADLYSELLRLREEAESAVIRVGEMAILATKLASLPVDDSLTALGELSTDDLKLWRLIHRRNNEPLAIEFENGSVNLPLPTLSAHIPEGEVRTIRFRVQRIGKRQAKLTAIKEITQETSGIRRSIACPKTTKLFRSPEGANDRREAWFLLYFAEYKNLIVEATVRMALKRIDFSASHLELIDILNLHELKAEMADITGLMPKSL
jgi:hypothetical protein